MNELKNYGLKFSVPDSEAYVFGGLNSLPKTVVNPSGDWSAFLPKYEPQFGEGWDTCGCTVWGTQNAIEMMLKQATGKEYNFSERYIYILADVAPPGADPHRIAETIRQEGLINEELLPMTTTYEEFVTPKPMEPHLEVQGQLWPYALGHEYVWTKPIPKDKRTELIIENLKYSPLGVSVTAWFLKDGLYVDKGRPNTHWCVLYGEDERGWKIFDSYDHSTKILSFDHNIQVAKRYALSPKQTPRYWWVDIISRVLKAMGL